MACHPEVIFAVVYDAFLLIAARALLRRGHRLQRRPAPSPHDGDVSWSHWEAGQFRRGLAITLLALAIFIAVVAGWAYHDPLEIALLGVVIFVLLLSAKSFGVLSWLLNATKLRASSAQQ